MPIQALTSRLNSRAIWAETAGAGPAIRKAGSTINWYMIAPPTQAVAASTCTVRINQPSAKPLDMLDIVSLESPQSGVQRAKSRFLHSFDPSEDTAIDRSAST